ncbi:MAG: hypothetical protein JWM41_3392 [Gemmatimonadetes bacterium]|nr:hypothetical protein [Gemmatimonadota bacterium]
MGGIGGAEIQSLDRKVASFGICPSKDLTETARLTQRSIRIKLKLTVR